VKYVKAFFPPTAQSPKGGGLCPLPQLCELILFLLLARASFGHGAARHRDMVCGQGAAYARMARREVNDPGGL
jgi:hypothetical protein